ncbi:MAG: hypothetical protein GTO24_26075 [candidate division Zixibacteria bacterium]|nr:hypothetical protein [candidate division Zixibacteria bacterium]
MSDVGTLKTPPNRLVSADVRFVFSGDSDGSSEFGNFEVLNEVLYEEPDFFVYNGDTVYPDINVNGENEALSRYREAYKMNRDLDALRDLLKMTSTFAIWDDHEILDDYDGQTVDPFLYLNGRKAFLEYMPILERRFRIRDPDCAGDPLFRVFHWGKDVDIIILDERSCRSADVESACLIEISPGVFIPDPAPTLPPLLRQESQLQIPENPPPGCLEAIFDPTRTMLGHVQKWLLKAVLLFSRAKFKFVINEVPIQQLYAFPYDRWEGYGAERIGILSFIRLSHIKNVIFLTTDTHANIINEVFIDRFFAPQPIAYEFVTGPIARTTLEQALLVQEDELGLPVLEAFVSILDGLLGVDCHELDAFSYGLVEVDATAGTATITLKDEEGAMLPGCTKTIGP